MEDYIFEMNLEDTPEKAARILPAILHALCDIIPTKESLQVLVQLPMFLKAVYVNGWRAKGRKQKVKSLDEFITIVKGYTPVTSDYDFITDELTEHYIQTTFFVLRKYVSDGEFNDIRSVLPKRLKALV